ncbi:unnamed protein product [Lymnaea stagnalis]|uniref:Uncharacterized protein n=1 Tax=Lymnaea stagnalis TaxID=6523 RepID=A0AAV2I581_LYMST
MLTDFEIALQLQWDEDDEMHVNSEVIARLLKEQETEMLNTATNEEIAILMQQDEVKAANDMVRSHQLAWQLQEEQAPPQSSSNEIWPGANSAVYQDVTRCHQMSHELAFNLFNPQNIQVETVYATSNHAHAEALRKQMERSDEANSDAIAKLIQQEEAEIAEARSLTLALQLHEEELRRRPTNDRERSTAPPHPYGRRPIHQHRVPTSQNSNNGTRSSSSRSLGFPAGGFPPRMRLLVSEFNQGHFVNNISNGESFFQGISPGVAGLMVTVYFIHY